MQRLLALVAAMMMTSLTVASACTAASPDVMSFNLRPASQSDRLHVEFRGARSRDTNWSTTFAAADLRGLDLARLRSSGNFPFSLRSSAMPDMSTAPAPAAVHTPGATAG